MDKRFRREKNISRHQIKHTSQKASHSEIESEGDTTPLEHISEVYTSIQSRNVVRNTVLLWMVLFVLLFCAGWVMPRVFSFHIDLKSIYDRIASTDGKLPTESETPHEDLNDILILGRGWHENDAPDLTDSIIYGHYNASDPASFTALSIPRDLYVSSKLLGHVKINEVYSGTKNVSNEDAAFQALLETISTITGREVKYFAMIDFSGFRKLIDQLGGIDIDVPERLYDNEYPTKGWGYTTVDIPTGLQHFDGDKALKYARSRHTTSDFDRSKRQQLIISALREKMLTLDILSSPSKIKWIFDTLSSSVKTNLSISQIFTLMKKLSKVEKENIIGHSLDNTCFDVLRLCHPGGLLYTPDRELFRGASVVIPKKATPTNLAMYDQIRLFTQVITTYPTLLKEFPITVVNASGRTNLALSIALKLRSIGFPVDERQIRNQKDKIEKTFIRYNSLIIKPDNVVLKALLSVFGFDIREATPDERISMIGSYELVLGPDSSVYFK